MIYGRDCLFGLQFFMVTPQLKKERQFCISCVEPHRMDPNKVKEVVFVPGTSCCPTISFSHFPRENVVFIVRFSNGKGRLTNGVCLVVPKSDCLTPVWVKQAPRRPL